MATVNKITPFLWFDTEAEDAATLYTSVFENSEILEVTHYGSAGPRPEGMVMTVRFVLDGTEFVALNGGPEFKFDEAVSFQISCSNQAEVDKFWDKLSEGGRESACGWLEDRFGLSWQVTPDALPKLLADPDPERAQRAMKAMMTMQKIDIAEIERAADAV